jgi:Right handed beta helix region
MFLFRCAIIVAGLLAVSVSHAVSQRTFVSTSGVNNVNCFLTTPCRDFTAALAATSPSGEIIVLDSGGYGSVTIGQSVSIIAPPGVYAGVSVLAGDGITVNPGAGGKVTLRGLTINGQGGSRGIVVTSGDEVHIEQCIITNMATDGIRVDGGLRVEVRSSLVRSNGASGMNIAAGAPEVRVIDSEFSRNILHGILVARGSLDAHRIVADQNDANGVSANPAAATAIIVTISDSAFTANKLTGAIARPDLAGASARFAVTRSTSARNDGGGFGINTFNVGTGFMTITDSAVLENNGNGIIVSGTNAVGVVTRSTVAHNAGFDFDQRPGSIFRSSVNNTLTGRGAPDINGVITPNPLQ